MFTEWIKPNTLEDFHGKEVLDCRCDGGQHVNFAAPYGKHVTGVDFNAVSAAKRFTKDLYNVSLIEADLAEMDLGKQFNIVYCIGVLHHTDDPTRTFRNIAKHCKVGGRTIVGCILRKATFLTGACWSPSRA